MWPPNSSCVRYGNVAGSRGSVIPLFEKQRSQWEGDGYRSARMTRFWITLDQGVRFDNSVHRTDAVAVRLRPEDPEHEYSGPGYGDRARLRG